mgnify:CR=1 FL=1
MNRQLAIQLMHKMQVHIWDLTNENAEVILNVLENPNHKLTLTDADKRKEDDATIYYYPNGEVIGGWDALNN